MQGCFLSSPFCKVINVSKYPLLPSGHGKLRVLSTFEHLVLAVWVAHCMISSHSLWYLDRDTCTEVLDKFSFFVLSESPLKV